MSEAATSLTPHLSCSNAIEAVEFYKKAFGAVETLIMKMPDGRLMHAGLSIHGANVMLAEEMPECNSPSPQTLGGTAVTLHLEVPDCDSVFQRAVEAGCNAVMPPQDMFWGARYSQLTDPYGHRWAIATTTRQVSPDEMRTAIESMPCGQA